MPPCAAANISSGGGCSGWSSGWGVSSVVGMGARVACASIPCCACPIFWASNAISPAACSWTCLAISGGLPCAAPCARPVFLASIVRRCNSPRAIYGAISGCIPLDAASINCIPWGVLPIALSFCSCSTRFIVMAIISYLTSGIRAFSLSYKLDSPETVPVS